MLEILLRIRGTFRIACCLTCTANPAVTSRSLRHEQESHEESHPCKPGLGAARHPGAISRSVRGRSERQRKTGATSRRPGAAGEPTRQRPRHRRVAGTLPASGGHQGRRVQRRDQHRQGVVGPHGGVGGVREGHPARRLPRRCRRRAEGRAHGARLREGGTRGQRLEGVLHRVPLRHGNGQTCHRPVPQGAGNGQGRQSATGRERREDHAPAFVGSDHGRSAGRAPSPVEGRQDSRHDLEPPQTAR